MDLHEIVNDVLNTFTAQKSKESLFWDDQSELVEYMNEQLGQQFFKTSADAYSVCLAVITETESRFEKVGTISSCVWKPILKGIVSNKVAALKLDYETTINDYKKSYPSPVPAVIEDAEKILDGMQGFIPLREDLTDNDTDAINEIQNMAADKVESILSTFDFDKIKRKEDMPYLTRTEALIKYRDISHEAFNTLLKLMD